MSGKGRRKRTAAVPEHAPQPAEPATDARGAGAADDAALPEAGTVADLQAERGPDEILRRTEEDALIAARPSGLYWRERTL